MTNRIYIIGAGTIGCALAVFLQQQHREVILVKASKQTPPHKATIEVVLKDGRIIPESIDITALDNIDNPDGVIVITVKSFANETIAGKLKTKAGNLPIVILQNGLGVEEAFIKQGYADLYRCVLLPPASSIRRAASSLSR